MGQSVSLRAALFSFSGTYLEDTDVLWTFSNATFPTSNLSSGTTASPATTFSPSTIGTTLIQATYIGSDPDVASPIATTGAVTVSSNQALASLSIAAGDGQSAVVNNNLSTDLKVRVLDTFGLPVAGAGVNWSVTQGGGSIISVNPSITDANGYAVATVKVGTVAGSNNQRFHAIAASNGSLAVDFQASALPGSVAGVVFATQPAGALATVPFITQPVVRVVDSYGNVASGASGNVVLSVQTGSGSLSGTLTRGVAAGSATFTGVSYSIQETGVVLHASFGAVGGNSSAFNVAALPPGACQRNDSYFTTTGGGCQDVTSGLVWSNISASSYNWYQAVWDSTRAGSMPPEASDAGRTNDYSRSIDCSYSGAFCDNDPISYCHSLNEGGMSDWRMPTIAELQGVYAHTVAGTGPYLAGVFATSFWSSDTHNSSEDYGYALDYSNGGVPSYGKSAGLRVYCVRDGARPPADHLSVTTSPSSLGQGRSGYSVVIQILDTAGNPVNAGGVPVTLASTSLGTLSGTLTANTNRFGSATFSAWTLDTAGSATVSVTAPSLTSTSFVTHVGAFPHTCKLEDSRFVTAQGGCKDLTTGLVWSLPAPQRMTWNDAVWGSTSSPLFNVQPDADDGGRTNDYDNSPYTSPDGTTTNYCHDLVEGGYTDWRLPKASEIGNLYSLGNGAPTHFGYDTNRWFWSSTTWSAQDAGYVAIYNPGTGASQSQVKWNQIDAICVRP